VTARHAQTVAFRFFAYDAVAHAGGGAVAGLELAARNSEPPAAKRQRASAAASNPHDAAIAVDLHASNQDLRHRNTELVAQVAALSAAAATDAAAAAAAVAALEEQLADARRAARADAEEVVQAAAAERAKAESRILESLSAVEAEKARATAAAAAAADAEQDALAARAERDAAQARARDVEGALDAARAKLEGVQDTHRAAMRGEREACATLREELASRDAMLTAERAEKEAALRRAERAVADADAAAAASGMEREKRVTAEAAAAKAAEKAAAAEMAVARLTEESRGAHEGGALESALQAQLIDFVRMTHAAAAAVLPHADALMQKRAQLHGLPAAATAALPESDAKLTQQVPQPHAAPVPSSAAPMGETQDLMDGDDGALVARTRAAAATPHGAPQSLLHGSLGLAGCPFSSEPEDAAQDAARPVLPPLDEGMCDGDDIPSASVQAEIDFANAAQADAAEAAARRQNDAAACAANRWQY
jgi:SWI/SNF-related matrix-associated actin-dependent regulator 1 of chromatin subfamily A